VKLSGKVGGSSLGTHMLSEVALAKRSTPLNLQCVASVFSVRFRPRPSLFVNYPLAILLLLSHCSIWRGQHQRLGPTTGNP